LNRLPAGQKRYGCGGGGGGAGEMGMGTGTGILKRYKDNTKGEVSRQLDSRTMK